MFRVKVSFLAACLLSLNACSEQFNILPFWKKVDEEREIAHRKLPTLSDDGKLMKVEGATAAVALSPVDKTFKNLCESCHGDKGNGDTPAGKALTPHPRNFTDKKWQESVDDKHIAKVIKEGGASVGLSPAMAPWGSMVDDAMIEKLVAKIRAFKAK